MTQTANFAEKEHKRQRSIQLPFSTDNACSYSHFPPSFPLHHKGMEKVSSHTLQPLRHELPTRVMITKNESLALIKSAGISGRLQGI